MDVRAQTSMVFHLDKCIGCHTCSVACKNIWTDRPGAEYMWWNNVETKPGTGYPTLWEDQLNYRGGWEISKKGDLRLKSQTKANYLAKLFYNPNQPGLDDYYEPWTYQYSDLFDSPLGDDQPTARPISKITGKPIDIKSGPNWDDDLSGSPIYAENDPNLNKLTDEERQMMFEIERISMMYLPRICNHCANPSCVASCPSGALYKRGEDGVVLVNQDKCRAWRSCVVACPYKKVYFNWKSGKSEKCILCYPRLEVGKPPACFHSCVGRIRYMGVILYDADRIEECMKVPDDALVDSQRSALLDPFDPEVIAGAKANGLSPEFIESAQRSPVWNYVMKWKIALPLHAEFRTMPMLYYVPPLLPVSGKAGAGSYEHSVDDYFTSLENSRMPIKFLASLFSAGNTDLIEEVLRKLAAVRVHRMALDTEEGPTDSTRATLRKAKLTAEDANDIYKLTTLSTPYERFVLPPIQSEEAYDDDDCPESCKGSAGVGLVNLTVKGGKQ